MITLYKTTRRHVRDDSNADTSASQTFPKNLQTTELDQVDAAFPLQSFNAISKVKLT
jgi:hypothetical protein